MIDLTAALGAVVAAFEEAGADYLVVGSTGAAAWGVARMTRDVDVVTVITSEGLASVVSRLRAEGFYVPADEPQAALTSHGSFNVIDVESGGKVDVFVASADDEFTQARLGRRVAAEILGVPTYVATAEDVVLAKLRWRLGSRYEVQWRDCVEIAAANDLDVNYLRRWAPVLAVEEDLDDLLRMVAHAQEHG
ncbi:MAG: hypothetical protein HYX32_10265 [Actinobacteria bacterium]|nr:hypothetical protein [Actinomycetota bacterium]